MTYWQYISARNKIASALRLRGVQRGDRVVIYGHNSLEVWTHLHARDQAPLPTHAPAI